MILFFSKFTPAGSELFEQDEDGDEPADDVAEARSLLAPTR